MPWGYLLHGVVPVYGMICVRIFPAVDVRLMVVAAARYVQNQRQMVVCVRRENSSRTGNLGMFVVALLLAIGSASEGRSLR